MKTARSGGSGLTKSQASRYCTSALKCIERKLTLRQFQKAVADMQAGRTSSGTKAFTSCEKSAIKKLKAELS